MRQCIVPSSATNTTFALPSPSLNISQWSLDRSSIDGGEAGRDLHCADRRAGRVVACGRRCAGYENPSQVERVFRGLKGIDLGLRPIPHHKEETVRGHTFLCLSAYCVERRLWEASAPLLFKDEESAEDRRRRDPPAPGEISRKGQREKASRTDEDGFELPGFETLSAEPATRTLNVCHLKSQEDSATLCRPARSTPLQQRALKPVGPAR